MAISQSWSQSSDAKTLYLTDTSTEDPTGYTRTFTLYDGINASGNLVATLVIPDGEDTVEYNLTADKYYSSRLAYTGGATLTPSVINFLTERFALNARDSALLKNCGGGGGFYWPNAIDILYEDMSGDDGSGGRTTYTNTSWIGFIPFPHTVGNVDLSPHIIFTSL